MKPTTERKPYGSQWKRKETPMRFTDRDGDMLEAVAVNRVLDRDLMLWLFPPEKDSAPEHVNTKNPERVGTNLDRRLTKLYRNGYLDRVRTVYGGPFLYAISDRGAALLRGDDNRAPRLMETLKGDDWQEKNRTLSTLFMTHTLAIASAAPSPSPAAPLAGTSHGSMPSAPSSRSRSAPAKRPRRFDPMPWCRSPIPTDRPARTPCTFSSKPTAARCTTTKWRGSFGATRRCTGRTCTATTTTSTRSASSS
jgi:hypothetical protein